MKVLNTKRTVAKIHKIATRRVKMHQWMVSLLFALVIISGIYLNEKDQQILEYKNQITELTAANTEVKDRLRSALNDNVSMTSEHSLAIADLESNIVELHSMAEEQSSSYDELQSAYNELQSQYTQLEQTHNQTLLEYDELVAENEKAEELYTDYSYMYYDTNGDRNDVTPEQVQYAVDLMTEKGLDPGLLLGSIMVESEGHADDVNSSSGATGYGQFLASTGRYIYEDVLQLGEYDHSTTPKDGTTNILMMATYYEILYKQYGGDTMSVIKQYCGGSDSFAQQYYQKVCNVVGYNIE